MKSAIIVLALSVFASIGAHAAKKIDEPKPWLQEPTSFMGISFGQKIEYSLPQCPKGYAIIKDPCREDPYSNLYTIKGTPFLGDIGYSLSAFSSGDAVGSFYLTTKAENFSELVQIFVTKYGPPTARSTEKVKTKSGADFGNETLTWSGVKISITLQKYDGDINTSSASVRTREYDARSAQSGSKSIKEAADKL